MEEKILCKFKCEEVAKRIGYGDTPIVYAAKFHAVMNDNEENLKFFAATPSGNIEVSTIRQDHFQVGKEYYVEFREVPVSK